MALPVPHLLPGEMFYDYTVNILWLGTLGLGNQIIAQGSDQTFTGQFTANTLGVGIAGFVVNDTSDNGISINANAAISLRSSGGGISIEDLSGGTITIVSLTGIGIIGPTDLIGNVTMQGELIDNLGSPGTAGQVLESTGTKVQWVTPGAGSLNYKTVRSAPTSFTQGGVVGPIALSFATPFADNNYTVEVTVLGDETAPGTPTITQYPSVGISYIAFQATLGAGVKVWVANNDSIAHTGIIHVIAIHD